MDFIDSGKLLMIYVGIYKRPVKTNCIFTKFRLYYVKLSIKPYLNSFVCYFMLGFTGFLVAPEG